MTLSEIPRTLVWKLTDQRMQTRSGCQWKVGKWNPAGVRDGASGLCSDSWYHAYPWLDGVGDTLALIRNPRDANIAQPRLWVAEVRGIVQDSSDFCKLGATEQRLVREVKYTPLTTEDRIGLAIHLAGVMRPEEDEGWQRWAEGWLCGRDRSYAAAYAANAAANAAAYAADAAANAAAYAAADAADAAADAAYAAYAANAAANAAYAAANAAYAPAHDVLRDAIIAFRAGVGQ